jgi:hypothetical protein
MSSSDLPSLLRENAVAEILNVSVRTVQTWRLNGRGPAFIRVAGAVRYSPQDLESFVDNGRTFQTSGPTTRDVS